MAKTCSGATLSPALAGPNRGQAGRGGEDDEDQGGQERDEGDDWKAIAGLLDDGEPSTLYKYNGIDLFCRYSIPFFTRMFDRKDFTVGSMTAMLAESFDAMDGEWAGVGHPEFWHTGKKASLLNAAALGFIVQEMAMALHKTSAADVQI